MARMTVEIDDVKKLDLERKLLTKKKGKKMSMTEWVNLRVDQELKGKK